MTHPHNTYEEMREEWNDAFLPEVPAMLKGFEIKNADGSYSCITCGIKKDAIADWWLSKFAKQNQELREKVEKMKIKNGSYEKTDSPPAYNAALNDILALIQNKPEEK